MTNEERAAFAKLTDWRSGLPQKDCDKIADLILNQSLEIAELKTLRPPWRNMLFVFVFGLGLGAFVEWLAMGAL